MTAVEYRYERERKLRKDCAACVVEALEKRNLLQDISSHIRLLLPVSHSKSI
jgi:hypothetical protein